MNNNHDNTRGETILSLTDISASYGSHPVLRDINLTVCEHDFLGVIGPNGGGKTTLMKVILGLMPAAGGKIAFYSQGKPVNHITMGYLPQYSSVDKKFPISVEEVILSGLSSRKSLVSRFTGEQREKVRQVIVRMGLENLSKRPIGQLSGGELQRTLLGRAIVSDPQLLILDEPSTYIDKHFEARLYEILAEINGGCAIILVSHDVDTVLERAGLVAFVNGGLSYHSDIKQIDKWKSENLKI